MPRLVSIVIPAHNEGEWVRRTVDAVLQNTHYAPIELIVVDDGSTDGSCEFLPELGSGSQRVRRVIGEALGVSRARNLGAAEARGGILVFMDAHVLPDPGWLTELVRLVEDPGVGMAGPCIRRVSDDQSKGYGMTIKAADLTTRWLGHPKQPAADVPCLGGGCVAIRREVFEQMAGFDPGNTRWGVNDVASSMAVWLLGYRCVAASNVEVAHLFKNGHDMNYDLRWEELDANVMRAAHILFDAQRRTAILAALKVRASFDATLQRVLADESMQQRRALLHSRFRYDVDWYFDRFAHLMEDLQIPAATRSEAEAVTGPVHALHKAWVCGRCGATNVGTQRSCLRCQVALPQAEEGAAPRGCLTCGSELAAHYHFCVNCGTAVARV